ncbi:hypothetical protein ACS0TY_018856 [Phlomoides rotata]
MEHVDPNEEGNEESGDNSKRSRTSEDGLYSISTNPETQGIGCSTVSHPTEIVAEIRALRLPRENDVVVVIEKMGMETLML